MVEHESLYVTTIDGFSPKHKGLLAIVWTRVLAPRRRLDDRAMGDRTRCLHEDNVGRPVQVLGDSGYHLTVPLGVRDARLRVGEIVEIRAAGRAFEARRPAGTPIKPQQFGTSVAQVSQFRVRLAPSVLLD